MIFFKELIKKLSSYIITYPKITMVISYTISSQVPRRRKAGPRIWKLRNRPDAETWPSFDLQTPSPLISKTNKLHCG